MSQVYDLIAAQESVARATEARAAFDANPTTDNFMAALHARGAAILAAETRAPEAYAQRLAATIEELLGPGPDPMGAPRPADMAAQVILALIQTNGALHCALNVTRAALAGTATFMPRIAPLATLGHGGTVIPLRGRVPSVPIARGGSTEPRDPKPAA